MLPASGRQHRGCIIPQAVTHSLVLLRVGEIIARNILSWLELYKPLLLHLVGYLYYCVFQSCSVFHRTRNLILDTLTVVFRQGDYCCTVVNTSCCFLSTHSMFDRPPDKRHYITHATKTNEINNDNQQSPNKPSRFTRVLRPRINIVSDLEPTAVFSRTRAFIVLGRTSGCLWFIHIHDIRCRTEGRGVFLHCVGSQLDVCHSRGCSFYRVPEHDSCHRDRGQGHD